MLRRLVTESRLNRRAQVHLDASPAITLAAAEEQALAPLVMTEDGPDLDNGSLDAIELPARHEKQRQLGQPFFAFNLLLPFPANIVRHVVRDSGTDKERQASDSSSRLPHSRRLGRLGRYRRRRPRR